VHIHARRVKGFSSLWRCRQQPIRGLLHRDLQDTYRLAAMMTHPGD